MKEYKIEIAVGTYTDVDLDKMSDIAFLSGKNYCGVGFMNEQTIEFYVCGKFSDAVRVYAALKNNGYKCIIKELCEE